MSGYLSSLGPPLNGPRPPLGKGLRGSGAAAALMAAAACSASEQTEVGLGTYPAPETVAEGEVIAEVGPVAFTTGEIERRLRQQSSFVRIQLQDVEQLARWVENEVRIETIAQEAWAEGLHRDPKVLAQFRQLLVKAYTEREMEEGLKELEPTRKELLEAYGQRREEFNRPAKVRLSQIVVYIDSERERKKAQQLLTNIRKEVIEGQKKNVHTVFAKAVREHSQDDATKLGAGDLQFLTRAQLAERYGQAVADESFDKATVGDLYVANAPNAVVLFKKTGRRRAVERSLEEVRAQLRNQLVQDKRVKRLRAWSSELLVRRGVVIDKEALTKVRVQVNKSSTPPVDDTNH